MKRALAAALLLAQAGIAQAAGGTWKYGYTDLQYTRFKYVVTVARAEANETIAVEGGASAQRAVDPRSGAYLAQMLGTGRTLMEYLPYALNGSEAPAAWPAPSGYPTYSTPYLEWKYEVRSGAWETVKTPAGDYKALRVEIEGNRGKDPDPFWWPKQAMRYVQTFWYAPDVGRWVRMHHRAWSMTGAQFAEESVELLEYRAD